MELVLLNRVLAWHPRRAARPFHQTGDGRSEVSDGVTARHAIEQAKFHQLRRNLTNRSLTLGIF